jgi:hypothetical protein
VHRAAALVLLVASTDSMCAAPSKKSLSVTVVASNSGTLEALELYLHGAGVFANGIRLVDRVLEMTPPTSAAVILFPDDFREEDVVKALVALQRERPQVLAVIVTHEPQRFGHVAGTRGSQDLAPLVIPKPAWAWTILDAVRARLDADDASAETAAPGERDPRPRR